MRIKKSQMNNYGNLNLFSKVVLIEELKIKDDIEKLKKKLEKDKNNQTIKDAIKDEEKALKDGRDKRKKKKETR